MSVLDRIEASGIVPVVVLEDAAQAVLTAEALLAGGIDVMEITFRTSAAADAIRNVSQHCPAMLVGAGTVTTMAQCKTAIQCGAQFVVSPGFDQELVSWCVEQDVPVVPGCVTPTEIMAAGKLGLKILKFFPANVFGGLAAMKNLSGPFGDIRFIPTGGVNTENIGEFISAACVHAVGGSWICPKGEIAAGNFDRITALSKQARNSLLGFEVAHVGIYSEDDATAYAVGEQLEKAFGFSIQSGTSSLFSSSAVEIVKYALPGKSGHIAIRTNAIPCAIAELKRRGFEVDMATAKYKNGRVQAVYLKDAFGGFAVHLLQR